MAKDAKKDDIRNTGFRPPIVAVLGHVDHGKTTLLDTIRKSNVAAKEHGGITQHIGAYQIEVKSKEGNKKITFIDTPGHETFSKIRSRGAEAGDIAILVVAVNDSVKPQTVESIKVIKQSGIPFIVAITKIDLSDKLEPVKKDLAKHKVLTEGFGGDIVCVGVSSKDGRGISDLLEMIILTAEIKGIKGDINNPLNAVIIESKIDKRRGVEASVIVKDGLLKVGQTIYISTGSAKVRAIINDRGEQISEAVPSTPCIVLGFTNPPPVGEIIRDVEKTDIAPETAEAAKPDANAGEEQTDGNGNLFKIILKADSQNSLEALLMSLPASGLEIISTGLGDITESDVFLAKTTRAFIVGFNVGTIGRALEVAKFEKTRIKTYTVIYELIDEISDVVESMGKIQLEEVLGRAKIIAEFPFDNKRIAGIKVIEGRIAKGDQIILKRDKEEIGRSHIKTMRKQKQETNKTEVGGECGILIDPNLDFKVDDMIVSVVS